MALVLNGAYAALLDGNLSTAAVPIAGVLRRLDREHAPVDPIVIELAVLWAAIAADSTDASADVVAWAWAWWSVTAATEHHGRGHLATRRARLILARVLSTHGDHLAAAEQYRHLIQRPRRLQPPQRADEPHRTAGGRLHANRRLLHVGCAVRRFIGDDEGRLRASNWWTSSSAPTSH